MKLYLTIVYPSLCFCSNSSSFLRRPSLFSLWSFLIFSRWLSVLSSFLIIGTGSRPTQRLKNLMGGTAFLRENQKRLLKSQKLYIFGRNIKTMNHNVLNWNLQIIQPCLAWPLVWPNFCCTLSHILQGLPLG